MPAQGHDVIVVGAGNAALCAALAAREAGSSVLVLEKGSREERGGNTYFTGGAFRFPYDGIDDIRALIPDLSDSELEDIDVGSYPKAAFEADLARMSGGRGDPILSRTLVDEAYPTMLWLRQQGMRWVLLAGRQAFRHEGALRFWGGLVVEAVGGGAGLSDGLFALVEKNGVEVRYDSPVSELVVGVSGRVEGVTVERPTGSETVPAWSVVLACGGFEANAEMRRQHLGPQWDLAKVRGTRLNTGDGLNMALEAGAARAGDWSGCHAVAWDLNAPDTGNRNLGDLYQKHSYPFGIVVNINGERFLDEGADFRNYTYARYGREILQQPECAAFQVFDAKVEGLLRDEYRIRQVTKASASTIEDLADKLGVDQAGLKRTVDSFNRAVQEGEFDPTRLDGKRTLGVEPPKSNWALPIDTPPFTAYAVTCGITFTFGGLRIDGSARVTREDGTAISGLYAAGEIVGGLFYDNYAGGSGLMAGAVFGRIAGAAAAAGAG
jgi:tricarballylate dehydrogenase